MNDASLNINTETMLVFMFVNDMWVVPLCELRNLNTLSRLKAALSVMKTCFDKLHRFLQKPI